jgi:hypothetical protein
MKYDWEKDAANEVRAKVNKLNESLSRKKPYSVLGVAIENEETGEAMFMTMGQNDGSVLMSDLLLDAVSDLEAQYHASVEMRRIQ